MADPAAAAWLLGALEGRAKQEVLSMGTDEVNNPGKIFAILEQHWGEHRDSSTLAGAFFRRQQGLTDEDPRVFWCVGRGPVLFDSGPGQRLPSNCHASRWPAQDGLRDADGAVRVHQNADGSVISASEKLWRTGRCRRPLLLCAAFWASPATTDASSRASPRLLVPSMTWSPRATHVTRRKGPTSPSCGTSSTRRRLKSWRQPWLQLLSWGLLSSPSPSSSRQTPAMTGWAPSFLKSKMGREGSWPTQVDGCVQQRRTRPTTPAWSWNSWPLNGQSQRSFVTTSWAPSSMSSQTTTPWSISELPPWVPLSKDGLPNSPSFTSRWSIGQGSPTLLMPFPECPLISTPKFPLHPCHPKSQWRRSWPVSISPLPQRRLSPACLQTPQPRHQRAAHQSHPVCLQPDSVNASWATSPLVQSSHRGLPNQSHKAPPTTPASHQHHRRPRLATSTTDGPG